MIMIVWRAKWRTNPCLNLPKKVILPGAFVPAPEEDGRHLGPGPFWMAKRSPW